MSTNKKGSAPPDPEKVSEALNSNMLREMINELEETKLKLLLNIKELKEKLVQQKDDQADIYFYLNKKCDESFEVIASLEEQIINEQTDREIAEKMYENRIEEQKTAHHTMEAKHLSKISELETRLEMLNSFNDEKEESEKNLKILMNKLEEERTQFRVNTENIENRFLVERDKLRKTYDQKYEKIKKELESSVEVKMSNKTKKTQLMNVIMKKELDNQSKHAEKLLEINQSMLERDKGLKLELDVVKGLHDDMTLRLTMSQRTIKQLNEKVVALEAAEATARQKHDAEMHTKAEAIIHLEAKLNKFSKKTTTENSKMDEMWHFLAQSYGMLKAPKKKAGQQNSAHTTAAAGSLEEHEQVLVGLVKEIVRRFPQILKDGQKLTGGQGHSTAGHSTASAQDPEDRRSQSPPAVVAVSTSVTTSWIQSQSTLSTGIPAWDMKTGYVEPTVQRAGTVKVRNAAVQTEGKLAPYPDGSLWMEAPGARSLLFQQQSAALASAAAMDGDNSSVGFQSVQSLWRSVDQANAAATGGSLASSEDNYSVKTASHVLQAPARTKTKPSKVIAKMRRQNMRNVNSGDDLQRASYMSIEGETLYAGSGLGMGGGMGSVTRGAKMPLSVNLTSPNPSAPSPLSLGSSSMLLGGGGMNMSNGALRPQSLMMSNAMFNSSAGYATAPAKPSAFSPLISISGQGFVAPLVLPKL